MADIYWNLTLQAGACLSYLGRADEAAGCFAEIRRGILHPVSYPTSSAKSSTRLVIAVRAFGQSGGGDVLFRRSSSARSSGTG